MASSFDVISIGAVLVDMIAKVVEFPGIDGESFVHDFKLMPGGAAANVAVICSRLGLKTAFVGKVGDDDFGKVLLKDLQKEKVHTKKTAIISKDEKTGSCYICVNNKGDRLILAHSGAADNLKFEDLPLNLLSSSKWVHLSDLRNISAIETLLERNIKINFSLSPGALIAQNSSRALKLVERANLLIGSLDEITKIFSCSEDEIVSVVRKAFMENQNKIIVVTKGNQGATIYTKESNYHIPIFNVPVVDTTGAGDAFTAGMLFSLTKGFDIEKAGKIAAACSAICIREVGARSGPKNINEVFNLLKREQTITKVV